MAGFSRHRAFLPLSGRRPREDGPGMTLLLLLAGLVALALVVPRWGTDSRDGQDWGDHADCRRCKAV
jgi:hypothetical protein